MFFKNGTQEVFQLTEKVPVMTWIAVRKWAIIAGYLLIIVTALAALIAGLLLPTGSSTDAIIFAVILLSEVVVCVFSLMFTTKLEQRRKGIFAGMDREHFVTSDHYSFNVMFDPASGIRNWMETPDFEYRSSSVGRFLNKTDLADADRLITRHPWSFEAIVAAYEAKVLILARVEDFRESDGLCQFVVDRRRLLAVELSQVLEEHDVIFGRAYDVQIQLEKGDV